MRLARRLLAATVASAGLVGPALATPPLTEPGTLAFSCAGHGNGNGYNGIAQTGNFYPGEYKCKEAFDPLGGKVGAKAAYTAPGGGTASAKGLSKWGAVQGQDTSQSLAGEVGRAIAGFNDRLTFTSTSQNGTWGYVVVALKVIGHIEAHGASGSAAAQAALFTNGGGNYHKTWSVSTDWSAPDAALDIDEVVELSFRTTFGSAVDVSTILTTQSGTRSVNGVGHGSTRITKPGLTWAGIARVTDKYGNALDDWSVTSASGIDWTQPCPCSPGAL